MIFLLSSLLQLAVMTAFADEDGVSLTLPAALSNDRGTEEVASGYTSATTRPVVDLEQFRVLELDQDGINWRQDWWKYLLMLLSGLICLCLIVYLSKVLFWLFGVLVCLGSGFAGGIFLHALFTPWLPALLPEAVTELVTASLICHILGGLLGYGAAACLLTILVKPLKQKRKNA